MLYYYVTTLFFGENRIRGDRGEISILSLALPNSVCGFTNRSGGAVAAHTGPVQRCLSGHRIDGALCLFAVPQASSAVSSLLTLFATPWQLLWSLPAYIGPEERFALAQWSLTSCTGAQSLISATYFIKASQDKWTWLRLHLQLVRVILNQHVSGVGFKNITCERGWKTWPKLKIVFSFHCGFSWVACTACLFVSSFPLLNSKHN